MDAFDDLLYGIDTSEFREVYCIIFKKMNNMEWLLQLLDRTTENLLTNRDLTKHDKITKTN